MPVFILLLGLAGIIGAAWIIVRSRGSVLERGIDGLSILSAAALATMLLARVVQLANMDWIEGKLAPVVGMFHSYPLYQDPSTGVMTGWIYGPVGAIVLSPAALAKHPTTARIIGNSITLFCSIAPTIWLLSISAKTRSSRTAAFSAFLVFGWMLVYAEDLGRCATIAGSDAPAIALAVCACAIIWRDATPMNCAVSALCVILAIWTKQTFGLLAIGLPAYLAAARNSKTAGLYAAMLLGWGIVISGIICITFGASNIYFHMVTLPRSHPLGNSDSSLFYVYGRGILDLIFNCIISVGLLCLTLLMDGILRTPAVGIRQWLATRQFSILLVAALAVTPGSLMGYLKISGYVNNLGCTDHLILLAALVGVVETCAKSETPRREIASQFSAQSLTIFALVFGVWCTLGSTNGLAEHWPALAHPYQNQEETIFDYAKAHPGEVYCPWDPLTTLLADGSLYHFEWGLADRMNSHDIPRPSNEQYGSHLPKNVSKIVYTREPLSNLTLDTITNFRRRIEVPELPGCVVFSR